MRCARALLPVKTSMAQMYYVFCDCICLSARIDKDDRQTTRPDCINFAVRVACGHGSNLLWRRCDKLYTIRYILPVLWITLCFLQLAV